MSGEVHCKHCGKRIRRPRRGENPAVDWVHDENGNTYCGLFAEPVPAAAVIPAGGPAG